MRWLAALALVLLPAASLAGSVPVRIDPAEWFRESDDQVLFGAAIEELSSDHAGVRADAASYLEALVRRLLSDNRLQSCDKDFSAYGVQAGQLARAKEKLEALAEKLPAVVRGSEAVPLARLLLEKGWEYNRHEGDELNIDTHGLAMLASIDDASVEPVLKGLLHPPHANREIVLGAIELIRKRKITSLRDDVAALSQDYRTDVRSRAVLAAVELGAEAPGSYETRRTLALYDSELRDIAAMVATVIPPEADWVYVRFPAGTAVFSIYDLGFDARWEPASPVSLSGWLIAESDAEIRVVDFTGVERVIPKAGVTVESRTLTDEVGADAVSLAVPPGVLPGVWAWLRGDAATAAGLLLPSYFASDDRRTIRRQLVDHLGRAAQERLVRAFSFSGDFAETVRLDRLLAGDRFDGYWYHPCAGELARQIESSPPRNERMTLQDWERFAATAGKAQQIERLVALMPSVRPPLGRDRPQSLLPSDRFGGFPESATFDPSVALAGVAKDISDVPVLARFLEEEDFVPAAVYPTFARHMQIEKPAAPKRVSEILASRISLIARQDVVRIREFRKLDPAGKRRRIDEIVAWAGGQATLSEADRELATLDSSWTDRPARMTAMYSLVRRGERRVLPYLLRQAEEEPQYRSSQLEQLYRLDDPRAVPAVRSWLAAMPREAIQDARRGDAFADRQMRVYGGLLLLRHGDRANLEGLDEIRKVLALDKSGYFSAIASDELRSLGRPDVVALLHDHLADPKFCDPPRDCVPALCRLIAAGDRRALDLLRSILEDGEPDTRSPNGVHYMTPKGDQMAEEFSRLRPRGFILPGLPATEMAARRRELYDWVSAQFELIVAGKPSELDCNRATGQTPPGLPKLPPVR